VKNIFFYALLGTMIHSAGCVINDMLDHDLDHKVGGSQSRLRNTCYFNESLWRD